MVQTRNVRRACRIATACLAIGCVTLSGQTQSAGQFEALPFAPRQAICYRMAAPPEIDGRLDERSWSAAPWSDLFVDIEGPRRPLPPFATRVKMLWDDDYLYIGADLEEPNLWATLTARDSVIFQDHDFEVFIDPDGDTHGYFEIEINALNTVWDLLLIQPYRDGGPALHAWDIAGLRTAVHLRGTPNRPGDKDEGWSLEMAIPWSVLAEGAPRHARPRAGDQWRLNFSRVEWQLDVRDGRYVKRPDPDTAKPLPENNWVWSPQGAINMHMPERWGLVQFSDAPAGEAKTTFVEDRNERVKWALRRLYYRQRDYREAHGRFAGNLAALNATDIEVEGLAFTPSLEVTESLYELRAPGFDGAVVHLRQDGRTWVTRRP
jgi:hypothetical protein